jgi:hypothetical protein
MASHVVIEGEIARARFVLAKLPHTIDLEARRPEMETDLTAAARERLEGEGVQADLTFERGSIEIVVLLTATKIVMEIGALLSALREIRGAFRKIIADHLGAIPDSERLEFGEDMLLGKSEDEKSAAAADESAFSLDELVLTALMALLVIAVTVGLVILGVNELS